MKKTKVTDEELAAIKVMMRIDPDAFWSHWQGWCMLRWDAHASIVCSRPKGHLGPHVAGLKVFSREHTTVKFCDETYPWYEDLDEGRS